MQDAFTSLMESKSLDALKELLSFEVKAWNEYINTGAVRNAIEKVKRQFREDCLASGNTELSDKFEREIAKLRLDKEEEISRETKKAVVKAGAVAIGLLAAVTITPFAIASYGAIGFLEAGAICVGGHIVRQVVGEKVKKVIIENTN